MTGATAKENSLLANDHVDCLCWEHFFCQWIVMQYSHDDLLQHDSPTKAQKPVL